MVVFREDFRGAHIAAAATALTGGGGIKGYGHITMLGKLLRIQAGGLLLHRTKRPGNHYGLVLLAGIKVFRQIQMTGHFKAKTVFKFHILGFNGVVNLEYTGVIVKLADG